MKAISNVVTIIIILVIVLSIILPALLVVTNNHSSTQYVAENYQNYRNLIQQYVDSGALTFKYYPPIYANPVTGIQAPYCNPPPGFTVPAEGAGILIQLNKEVTDNPVTLNITMIFYLINGQWVPAKPVSVNGVPVTSPYPLVVTVGNSPVFIELNLNNCSDVVVVLSTGTMIFLAPGGST